jgi:acetyltransferase-like isoleucine patch superfamily enzyme
MGVRGLTVTPELLDYLAERRVFQSLDGAARWTAGTTLIVNGECRIEPYSTFYAGRVIPRAFGAFSYTRSQVAPHVSVGRYCSLAGELAWMGVDHPWRWASTSAVSYDSRLPALRAFQQARDPDPPPFLEREPDPAPISIGHDVWIGDQAMIAPGVTIGDGAVIAARALVRRDVPPYAMVVGSPARIVRLRFAEALVERFLAARWWRFAPDVIRRLPIDEPERFLDGLEARLARGDVPEMDPTPITWAGLAGAAGPRR